MSTGSDCNGGGWGDPRQLGHAPGSVKFEPRPRKLRLHERAAVQRLAECLPLLDARGGKLERGVADAAGTHAVVQAARAEAPLRDLKASALPKDHVAHRHPAAALQSGSRVL